MPLVVRLAKARVQAVHSLGKVRFGRLDHEMVMVDHEAKGVASPAEALDRLSQGFQKLAVVIIVEKDLLATISPGCDMVDGACKFNAQRPGHIPTSNLPAQTSSLKP